MPNAGAKLPTETWDVVKARAQRILDLRGQPPYNHDAKSLSADEAHVLSEFVQFWLPFLVEKEKVK